MTVLQLIDQLAGEGGVIVCSGDCTVAEIVAAQSCGRFAANSDGIGFVRRPKEWLEINKWREGMWCGLMKYLSEPNTPMPAVKPDIMPHVPLTPYVPERPDEVPRTPSSKPNVPWL